LPFKILGDLNPLWCAVASVGESLTCAKICEVPAPTGTEIVSWRSRFGWVQTRMSYFLDSGPSSPDRKSTALSTRPLGLTATMLTSLVLFFYFSSLLT